MLNLRRLYFFDTPDSSDPGVQSFSAVMFRRFTSNMIGNLGATLRTEVSVAGYEGGRDPDTVDGASVDWIGGAGVACVGEWDDEPVAYCDDPFAAGIQKLEDHARIER
ncbi:hypothetical protein ONZ51_g9793 [Trametes cubensis]|uniref:Uncharacterized protein n=1 Tax=Trametes cubensis TaxID=1111947 RepID=A0AAD7X9H1_9APHY|nr:hypothetical protein ONZ51_g9793 [Trametes cubensis]